MGPIALRRMVHSRSRRLAALAVLLVICGAIVVAQFPIGPDHGHGGVDPVLTCVAVLDVSGALAAGVSAARGHVGAVIRAQCALGCQRRRAPWTSLGSSPPAG